MLPSITARRVFLSSTAWFEACVESRARPCPAPRSGRAPLSALTQRDGGRAARRCSPAWGAARGRRQPAHGGQERSGAARRRAGPGDPVPSRGPSAYRRAVRSSVRSAPARGCGGRLLTSSPVPDPYAGRLQGRQRLCRDTDVSV